MTGVSHPAPDDARRPARTPPVRLLIAFGIIGPISIHLILPSLPQMQRQFASDYATVQLLISLYMIFFGGSQLLVGPLVDLVGRRKTLISGLALYTVCSALCAVVSSLPVLIGLRMAQGIGACVGLVLARAIIRDHYGDRQSTRMLGLLAMGIAVGPMLAPMVGGALYEMTGWRGPFLLMAATGAIAALLAWRFIDESGEARTGDGRLRALFADIAVLLRGRRFVFASMNICFQTAVFYAFVGVGPYIGDEFLRMTPKEYGAWFSLAAIGFAAGSYIAGWVANRLDARKVVLAASLLAFVLCSALTAVLATEARSAPMVFGILGLTTFASAFVMANSMADALGANPKLAGSASGFAGFVQFSFTAATATGASMAIEHWHRPAVLGYIMLGAAFLSVVTSTVQLLRADDR